MILFRKDLVWYCSGFIEMCVSENELFISKIYYERLVLFEITVILLINP